MTKKEQQKEKEDKEKKPVTTVDDLYRHSTQYRLWSFTENQLKERRTKVNVQGKRRALKKLKVFCERDDNDHKFETSRDLLQLVSEDEELLEVNYYVDVLQKLSSQVLKLPSQVRATAVAFLKRFYLVHSVMEHHPKKVLATCLFLAAKSENCFMAPKTLAEYLGSKTTPESILELEFPLVQALLFTMLCHHPYRALHGFLFDFQGILIHRHPNGVVVTRKDESTGEKKKLRIKINKDRIMKGYVAAREWADVSLKGDTAFLFTPPQIALACFLKVDEEMTVAYLTYKFVKDQHKDRQEEGGKEEEEEEEEEDSDDEDNPETKFDNDEEKDENKTEEEKQKAKEVEKEKELEKELEKEQHIQFYKKMIKTLRSCIRTMDSVRGPTLDEAKTIDKKVHYCINPDKLLKRKRQEGADGGQHDAKKIKLEGITAIQKQNKKAEENQHE